MQKITKKEAGAMDLNGIFLTSSPFLENLGVLNLFSGKKWQMFRLSSTRVFKVITRVSIILITREITRVIDTRALSLACKHSREG